MQVFHVNEFFTPSGIVIPEDILYVGRDYAKWSLKDLGYGNPFVLKDRTSVEERRSVISRHRHSFLSRFHGDFRRRFICDMTDKRGVACFCRRSTHTPSPHNLCHGDTLIEIFTSL